MSKGIQKPSKLLIILEESKDFVFCHQDFIN